MQTYTLDTVRRPWADLKPHPNNPRNGDIAAIAESLRVNGQYRPIVTTEDGTILAGNHTYMAAGELKWQDMACVVLDIDPTSPAARRIMLADNRTADLGSYDDGILFDLMRGLDAEEGGLLGTGYSYDDLTELSQIVEDPLNLREEEDRETGRGALLNIADLSYGEPKHTAKHGDRFTVGHHILHVCDPHREWDRFLPDLKQGVIFAPYPEPYLTITDTARETPMLLVQPSARLAGHLLDKHAAAFGEAEVGQ